MITCLPSRPAIIAGGHARVTTGQGEDLLHNSISNLGPLGEIRGLQILHILRNEISALDPLSGLEKLQIVWAADNKIEHLPTDLDIPRLAFLILDGNPVQNLGSLSSDCDW